MTAIDLSRFLALWQQPGISPIADELLYANDVGIDLLRLDQLHPEVSGNKWYKLKYNIGDAIRASANGILSFGGPYSNHLHALAYAGHRLSLPTLALVRGEEVVNPTLEDCRRWGMQLQFVSRTEYRQRYDETYLESLKQQFPAYYIVPEGGNNAAGRKGCTEILQGIDLTRYTHLGTAVGSGATLAGILDAVPAKLAVLGFAALKQAEYLHEEISGMSQHANWTLMTDAHEGGFGKHTPALLQFMQEFNDKQGIALDLVYTGKMMKAVYRMIAEHRIPAGSRMLLLHTGGVQGNRSIR